MLDASVLIGFLDSGDEHHDAAGSLLENSGIEPLGVSTLTMAEVLVMPARSGRTDLTVEVLECLDLVELPIENAIQLAEIRARTGLKMSDCCVLEAAKQNEAGVATFDGALAGAATKMGLTHRKQ